MVNIFIVPLVYLPFQHEVGKKIVKKWASKLSKPAGRMVSPSQLHLLTELNLTHDSFVRGVMF